MKVTTSILESARVKVVCLVSDESVGTSLVAAFKATSDRVAAATAVQTGDAAVDSIANGGFNAICIDLFHSIGVTAALTLIGRIRTDYPQIPVCLLGNVADFASWPGVPTNWKTKFQHYYKIELDAEDTVRREQVDLVFSLFLADAIKAAGFDHYQTLRKDFIAKEPRGRRFGMGAIVGAAGVVLGFLINYVEPRTLGVEQRTCDSLRDAYPDRVLCTGTAPGFFWRAGDRLSAFPAEGYTSAAIPLRCDDAAATAARTGEIARAPGAALTTTRVVPAGDFSLQSAPMSSDPDAGIFAARCLSIPDHQWLTWLRLR